MNKVLLGGVLAVAAVGVAYAGWFGWGGQDAGHRPQVTGVGTPVAEAPVQIPVAVSATLPPGHPLHVQKFDRVLGDVNAPVTMIEYASMTCSHCAEFHQTTMKDVQREWIDTGKVKYVLRDLPWDNLALGIAKVTRCAEPAMFYPLVTAYFEAQKSIVTGVDTLGEVKKVARLGGMDAAKVEACIQDAPLQALITGVKENGLTQLKITGTPTSFVNGVKVDGGVPYKDLKPVLEGAYRAAMVARQEAGSRLQAAGEGSPTVFVTPTVK